MGCCVQQASVPLPCTIAFTSNAATECSTESQHFLLVKYFALVWVRKCQRNENCATAMPLYTLIATAPSGIESGIFTRFSVDFSWTIRSSSWADLKLHFSRLGLLVLGLNGDEMGGFAEPFLLPRRTCQIARFIWTTYKI